MRRRRSSARHATIPDPSRIASIRTISDFANMTGRLGSPCVRSNVRPRGEACNRGAFDAAADLR
jgi:hypothetical protein